MPFKNKEQRKACYSANDPDWDCEKYAKGEDNEDDEEDGVEEEEESFNKTVNKLIKQYNA